MIQPSKFIKDNSLAILSPNCLNLIDKFYADIRLLNIQQIAYVLATVKHETDNTYTTLREYGRGVGKDYGYPDPETKKVYYGRGYVQLTWKSNYAVFGSLLKEDLVNDPDLALRPDIAYEILIIGMTKGLFTGRDLNNFINYCKEDYVNARKIVNGLDDAQLIADYAIDFEKLLLKVPRNG